ncbi:MAG: ABC transporter ATP-binding protein/permease [Bacteroidia bacterium]|nr:ABC transporter ATP-binding protein/permease [Bacteroidia bacterium]
MAKSRWLGASAKEDRYGGELSFRDSLKALRHLPPFLKLIWATSPGMTFANILLRLLQAGIPVSTLYLGKLIVDEVVALMQSHGDQAALWWYVGIELALGLFSAGLGRTISLVDALLGDLLSNKTSEQLIEHAAKLDLEQFEDAKFYDKLERARQQTTARTFLMSQILGEVQDAITVIFLGVGLVAFNPWLILILFLAVIPAFLSELHFNQRSYSMTRNWTPERRELDYIRFVGASDQMAKEVKIFGLAQYLKERFAKLAHTYYEANKGLAIRRAGWGFLFTGLGTLGYYAAYVVIILQAISGSITLGDLTFLSGSFARMRGLLQSMLTQLSSIAQSALYLQDLFEFLNLKPTIASPAQARPFPVPVKEGFSFEQVSYKYLGSEKYAIKDLSFRLHPGEKLALVGENGAGKTTLVKLISRLYDPTEGRILLDGHDLKEYDLASLRENIGVIFQDFIRFNLKAGENIAVGRIDAREESQRIEDAAQRSLADTVVESLPEGYNQMLGKRFDGGVDLSGGQWQKIALARAYMRDAQLLILDEPTSALDARAEFEVFERFADLTKGKMAVLISHRFSTVRMADRILVIEQGKLQENGSHAELLALNGTYAELFNLQAQGYL